MNPDKVQFNQMTDECYISGHRSPTLACIAVYVDIVYVSVVFLESVLHTSDGSQQRLGRIRAEESGELIGSTEPSHDSVDAVTIP
jgi:hypothetical protein